MSATGTTITICRSTRRNLRYILLWPSVSEEPKSTSAFNIRIVVYVLITAAFSVCVAMHLIVTTTSINDFSGVTSLVCVYYVAFTFTKNQPKVARLLMEMSNFEKFGKPPNFDQEDETLNFVSTRKEECEEKNRNDDLNENCGFVTPIWTPFSTKNHVVYYLLQAYVVVCVQLLLKPSALVTFTGFELTTHLILRIKQLNQMIHKIFVNTNYEIARRRLNNCLVYHADLIRMAKALDECFSSSMFMFTCITAIVIACIEKQFIEGDHFCAVVQFCGWTIILVLACWSGQILMDASESISVSIWFSKWYEADTRLQKDILLMLKKSQEQFALTAGPFSSLSFQLLVSMGFIMLQKNQRQLDDFFHELKIFHSTQDD
ncbi:odorant receptor 4-like [Zophobas morio]|uniref:odorant receptor 4-like n=1 Tax=Zophobas morio TaxID=2755281 RepID=UPI003082FE22